MIIRDAQPADVPAMSAMLYALKDAGKRTRPCDEAFVMESYVASLHHICCYIAVDGDEVLGLQTLTHAYEGNPYNAPLGSGMIGTHVSPNAARRGIGRGLFERTLEAAREAGLTGIEAFIQKTNDDGHFYYGAMGFEPVREDGTALVRFYTL
ncbi:MAG: GNAT family N-acetyltransferase [Pseudomonadota bacterium]